MYDIKNGISQTVLKEFMRCPASCRAYLLGYRLIRGKRALWLGELMHEYLDVMKKSIIAKKLVKITEITNSPSAMKLINDYRNASPEMSDMIDEVVSTTEALFTAYFVNRYHEMYSYEWLSSEETFDVEYNGVRLRGKYDGVIKYKDGTICILDHKNMSRQPEEMIEILSLDFQILFYIVAAMQMGHQVNGFLYDVIRPPTIKQKKSETHEQYVDRLLGDTVVRPEFYFKPYFISYTPEEVDRLKRNLDAILQRFTTWYENGMEELRYPTGCRTYYGSCQYLKLCAFGEANAYRITDTAFEELDEAGKE